MIFTPSNFLSLLRGFLVILFLKDDPFYRSLAIVLAMLTDSLDGYLARRWHMISPLGTILDPLMDKFFVFSVAGILIYEQRLQAWEALALISRDFAILFFGLYLTIKGTWSNFKFQSIWAGKIATTIQFFVLLALTFNLPVPSYIFFCFIFLGLLAFIELYFIEQQSFIKKSNE